VDLVYIPAFSIHSIVNLEPVVGFAVELEAYAATGIAKYRVRRKEN